LRHGVGVPMEVEWIAKRLGYSEQQVQETIDMGAMDKDMDGDGRRIKVWEDGTIELCNFREYNPLPTPKKPLTDTPPETSQVDSNTKRRAIHDKFQREHLQESRFHLEGLEAGVPDTFPELAKAQQKDDQRFMRKLRRDVKVRGPEPLPRLEGL